MPKPKTIVYAKRNHGGTMYVKYRAANGKSFDARVIGAGSVSGLKLLLVPNDIVKDNVAPATGLKQTNVYFSYMPAAGSGAS